MGSKVDNSGKEPPTSSVDPQLGELFTKVEKNLQGTELGDERWYIVAASCLVAGPDPEVASQLYLHLCAQPRYRSPEARRALVRRLREALLKAVSIVGVCKPIEAILAIDAVTQAEDKDYSSTREGWKCDEANLERALGWYRKIYTRNAADTIGLFDAHKDFAWVSKHITYGLYLSDRQVLDDIDTEMVVLSAIMGQNLRTETWWHIRGTRRIGVSKGDTQALWDTIYETMGHFGTKLNKVPTVDEVDATILERKRAALPPPHAHPSAPGDLLSRLSLSRVKDLCDNFFATFNLANPILDRKLFTQHTMGVAINSEFGSNMESCLVLVVMALGSLGRMALREAGFRSSFPADPDDARPSQHESGSDGGLMFFNEARKRAGFVNCDNGLQSCQYYLLSGLFYAQLLRPIDWWTMVNRASVCCTGFWACPPEDRDEWVMDMQSRLFWNTAMFEDVLTQELDLPVSNLRQYGDRVPLPKFVEFPGISSFVSMATTSEDHERDSFCHYHFLSQIAHRIILTRMRDSMFASPAAGSWPPGADTTTTTSRGDYPPQALEAELLHQIEQWREQLPEYLQWDDGDLVPSPSSPENILVVSWLRSRYLIARYHLRRPLL
ncbi:uncharacterized protein DNG_02573 [Cephalotrichum gorgonifer]|uniref:Carboxymuconolactone decarboxylase-like domain-containing protein n=1 Tax=Cephalotrichum gorgonifer TaxID=2041049 RepID=A0AAE8MU58_9PEZI|nr:uncharacterized protein DNG_02573 [Cephalotrichum gorgonifer]